MPGQPAGPGTHDRVHPIALSGRPGQSGGGGADSRAGRRRGREEPERWPTARGGNIPGQRRRQWHTIYGDPGKHPLAGRHSAMFRNSCATVGRRDFLAIPAWPAPGRSRLAEMRRASTRFSHPSSRNQPRPAGIRAIQPKPAWSRRNDREWGVGWTARQPPGKRAEAVGGPGRIRGSVERTQNPTRKRSCDAFAFTISRIEIPPPACPFSTPPGRTKPCAPWV